MKRFTLLCSIVCLLATPLLAGDILEKTEGTWLPARDEGSGPPTQAELDASPYTVLSEHFDKIEYKIKGVPTKQPMDADKVKKVWYGERNRAMLEAADALNNGNYQEALDKYETVAGSRSSREPQRMWAFWNMGRIYQDALGDYANAIATWERLEKEIPKAAILPKAIVRKGQAYLARNDVANAQRAFQSLQRLRGLPAGQQTTARYWIIYIQQSQGQYQEALDEFRKLFAEVQGKEELKDVAILAQLGIGECMLGLKQFGQAVSFFQKIADSSNDKAVLAGAFNGLGRCYFEQQKWKEAYLAFLRVVILYNENPDQTAMATYYAGRSYFMSKGNEWKERSRSLLRECIAKYPGIWAKQAQEYLPNIR